MDICGPQEPQHLSRQAKIPSSTLFQLLFAGTPQAQTGEGCSTCSPVHNSRDALPGPKACHALQLFIRDPGRNYDFLWVTATEPVREVVQKVECRRYRAVTHLLDNTNKQKKSSISNLTAVHLSKLFWYSSCLIVCQ